MTLRTKIRAYARLLRAKDPAVVGYVAAHCDDKRFMLYVRLHAAIATGLLQGSDSLKRHG